MKVFSGLGGCLYAGPEGPLSRSTWYCLPVKAPLCLTEESVEGAVYTVATRQIPVAQAASAGRSHGEESVASLSSQGTAQVRALKAGTLQALVLHLLDAFRLGDNFYLPAFLATYRTFTSAETVLRLLLDRLENEELERHQKKNSQGKRPDLHSAASTVFCSWMDGFPEDFQESLDAALLDRLTAYLTREFGEECEPERRRQSLLQMLKEIRAGGSEQHTDVGLDPSAADETPGDLLDILMFLADHVAAQLTLLEADLFQRVVPYQCLGSVWSRRDKKGNEHLCPSVRATVLQFNKLANAVISCCLCGAHLRPQQRARIFEKWIKVAEECRALKNFSSLYAIISALQSNPVHRLKKTWEETSRDAVRSYEELRQIFSENDNYSQIRELLFKSQEETLKPASIELNLKRQLKHPKEQRAGGVVPYLGTFLKDLVMLDTAAKDELENGYINFDKRRKEFEILTQIRLLQSICKNYTFERDPVFMRWFQSLQPLSEADSHNLSCDIEPQLEPVPANRPPNPTVVITHCTDMLASIAAPFGPGGFIPWDRSSSPNFTSDCAFDLSCPRASEQQLKPGNPLLSRLAKHMKSPSVSSLDQVGLSPPGPAPPLPPTSLAPAPAFVKGHRRSASCGSAFPSPQGPASSTSQDKGRECRIIRVRMDLENGNMYKSILVTSQDKTPAVIAKVLEKHNQDLQEASNYELVQLMPDDKELCIPRTANVFYAMSASSLDFLLRKKGINITEPSPSHPTPVRHRSEPSATFPKIKSRGLRLARALF
ncbi:ral guanine nucleotide dissociation stimulator-like 2 isoform X2 [Microcaecilia unicolor]|uniref:Ral guanine nucleotide dissociation stimulator-like 2 isoform X2 n=1 Tax=Microcaecilia unicolor TaxID=1415580 RepID=A0A6P7XQX4_9AMPH|nr:ral guanine nucleotide dissociation stimulator-like 2 isoform X2 [Microcaecilia unicolor]